MTRANLNFIYQNKGEAPSTLYCYYNGDQYPDGLRDHFGVIEWLKDKKAFTPDGFRKWIKENYESDIEKISHPAIHYNESGFPTDYSYIFSNNFGNRVTVYNWDERIFKGNVKEFVAWLEKQ